MLSILLLVTGLLLTRVVVVKCKMKRLEAPTVNIEPTHDFCVNLYPPGYNESHKVKLRNTVIVLDLEEVPNRAYPDPEPFIGITLCGSPQRRFKAAIFQCRINDTPIGYFEEMDLYPEFLTYVDCPPGIQNTVWYSNMMETTHAVVHWQPNFTLEAQHNVSVLLTIIQNRPDGLVFHTATHIYYPSMRRNKFMAELSSFDSDIYNEVKDSDTETY